MEVSPYYAQNAYGPFGYAVGRAASADVCIYGWQRIAPGLSPSGNISRGSVSIRLQVCDRAAGEERLLNLMYQMRLRDPVFEPWRASPRIGAAGAPILPTSAEAPALVAGPNPTPTPAARPVQPAPAPQPATPVAVVEPQPSGPIVPLPSGSGGGQGTGGGSVTVPLPPSSSN